MSKLGSDYCLAEAIAIWAKGNPSIEPEIQNQRQAEADELYDAWMRERESEE